MRKSRFRPLAMALAVASALPFAPSAGSAQSGRPASSALWYLGTYTNEILVFDDATEQVIDRLTVRNPIPVDLTLSRSEDRLYVLDASMENVEVVELASKRVVDEFTLSEGTSKVRIAGFEVSPDQRTMAMLIRRYTRRPDRWEVEGPTLVRYDLDRHAIRDTIPWPDGQEREGLGMMYSPDGRLLYLFTDDVIALDADSLNEVDRWKLSSPLEPGMGRMALGFRRNPFEEEGVFTNLFRVTDPVQNRRMMGIARVRLAEQEVDYYTLGPGEPVSFVLAADGRTGYGLFTQIGRYEFWRFDLESRSVVQRVPFAGRPRMGLMPSADGTRLFIYVAGNTIDVYDAQTFEYLRTVELDTDMTSVVVVPRRGPAAGS